MSRYLDPKSDIVFKHIFGKHPALLRSFLNALLPLPADSVIESLEYLNPEHVPEIPSLKRTIVDVRCTDQKGRQFIVEMQIEWVPAFMQRMLFNTTNLYVKQLEKGRDYNKLHHVYGLALLARNFDPNDPHCIHHYKMTHQRTSAALDDIQLIFVELPKFKPDTTEAKRLAVLWLRFISEINEKTETVDPELLKVAEIKKAVKLAEESAYTRSELDAYHAYWDSVSTEVTLLSGKFNEGVIQGRKEGQEEGRKKGQEEGREEGMDLAIRRLLRAKMEAEKIADLLGVTLERVLATQTRS